jgi:hypothetical protein
MMKYRYYWRIEPSVRFSCDIRYDPFLTMMDEKKVYGEFSFSCLFSSLSTCDRKLTSSRHSPVAGFTLSMFEFTETIETLWNTTLDFMKLHPEHVAKDNSLGFLSDDGGKDYSLSRLSPFAHLPRFDLRSSFSRPLPFLVKLRDWRPRAFPTSYPSRRVSSPADADPGVRLYRTSGAVRPTRTTSTSSTRPEASTVRSVLLLLCPYLSPRSSPAGTVSPSS